MAVAATRNRLGPGSETNPNSTTRSNSVDQDLKSRPKADPNDPGLRRGLQTDARPSPPLKEMGAVWILQQPHDVVDANPRISDMSIPSAQGEGWDGFRLVLLAYIFHERSIDVRGTV